MRKQLFTWMGALSRQRDATGKFTLCRVCVSVNTGTNVKNEELREERKDDDRDDEE